MGCFKDKAEPKPASKRWWPWWPLHSIEDIKQTVNSALKTLENVGTIALNMAKCYLLDYIHWFQSCSNLEEHSLSGTREYMAAMTPSLCINYCTGIHYILFN